MVTKLAYMAKDTIMAEDIEKACTDIVTRIDVIQTDVSDLLACSQIADCDIDPYSSISVAENLVQAFRHLHDAKHRLKTAVAYHKAAVDTDK